MKPPERVWICHDTHSQRRLRCTVTPHSPPKVDSGSANASKPVGRWRTPRRRCTSLGTGPMSGGVATRARASLACRIAPAVRIARRPGPRRRRSDGSSACAPSAAWGRLALQPHPLGRVGLRAHVDLRGPTSPCPCALAAHLQPSPTPHRDRRPTRDSCQEPRWSLHLALAPRALSWRGSPTPKWRRAARSSP